MRHSNPTSMKMRAAAGFTVVELMITVVIVAILVSLAAPTMRSFIENARIRAASESLQNGITLARNEAVRRNVQVEFVRLNPGWVVRLPGSADALHSGGAAGEGASSLDFDLSPAGADRVTFDPFGRITANADTSDSLTGIDIASTNPPTSGNYRPLRIQLQSTGVPRLCNPAAASTESKACL